MEFFNRKEEVLEIQLTQEGKRLLAKGEFKPFYYQFFDDDVLYDTAGAAFSELQNESIPRIKETPRIKTQNIVYGLETEFNKLKQIKEAKEQQAQGYKPKVPKNYLYNKNHDPLKYPLGLGDFSNNYKPAFNLQMLSGLIVSSSFTYSPEADYYEYIPQLEFTCSYVYQPRNDVENYGLLPSTKEDKIFHKSPVFVDDTYYVIREKNSLHLLLKELNSVFDKQNFDIEVFEVEKTEKQKENLNPLYFNPSSELLILEEQLELYDEDIFLKPKDVEWFFSVLDDEQIVQEEENTGLIFDPYSDENADDSQEAC
jgi:hypothetical protein